MTEKINISLLDLDTQNPRFLLFYNNLKTTWDNLSKLLTILWNLKEVIA